MGKAIVKTVRHYTLLLIIGVWTFANPAFAQTPPPEGLKMDKTWTATNATGSEGYVTLEAFVTGESVTTYSAVPTDIVLVVDQSRSMTDYYLGNVTRLVALKRAATSFVETVRQKAEDENVNHKVAIVGFAAGPNGRYENTELLSTETEVNYRQITDNDYKAALVDVNQDGQVNKRLTNAIAAISANGGTYMQYGMEMAKGILDKREETTYETDDGALPRATVVVFFTDGYPGGYQYYTDAFCEGQGPGSYAYDQQSVSDAAVAMANSIKESGARVFSIGIFGDASPETAYTTTKTTAWGYTIWTTGVAAANGLMHFISSDFGPGEATSWSALTESPANVAGYHDNGFYYSANDAAQLTQVFTSIANMVSSVPLPLNAQTIVQDEVSQHFHLPDNALEGIRVYTAPFTGGNPEFGDKVPMEDPDIVIEGNQVRVSGFDFAANWCGMHNGTEPQGNKLIIEIPLVVNDGVWGDGLPTNGNMSVIYPDGDLTNPYGPFPMPYANVLGEVWTEVVTEEPLGFRADSLYRPEDLAWFISLVNGRQGYSNYDPNHPVDPHPTLYGKLAADIDMSAHNWVAIGSNGIAYEGEFDGNGYVITGLKNNASKYYQLGTTQAVVYPGMFGKVSGTVHDVFVLDSDFHAKKHAGTKIHYGIIIDTLAQGGMLYNSEAAGRLMTNDEEGNDTLIFGGLVGLNWGEIHSCMSMAQLTGFNMGGAIGQSYNLTGDSNKNKIENLFTNPQFNYIGDNKKGFVGGFTAISEGNRYRYSYMRFERPSKNLDQAVFGMAVGRLVLTTVAHTYQQVLFPVESLFNVPHEHTGQLAGIYGGVVMTPYGYTCAKYLYHREGDIEWMLTNLTNIDSSRSTWKRTTAGNYSAGAGDINDDYPILAFDYACVGSSDGIVLDYGRSLDEMLDRHNMGNVNEHTTLGDNYKKTQHAAIYGGTINLYANQSTDRSTTDHVMVYIDEDISLLQDEGSVIDAYTCQTMKTFCDKNGERWHNVSSSLSSDIGFSYANNGVVPHNWDPDPCGLILSQTDDHALFPSDAPVSAIDFYCFYEPQYHWLNFKRNSLSHWHMDNYEVNIPYPEQEDHFIPGKGYLLAIDKEQFLQNRGVLNNGAVTIPVTASAPEWTGLRGYNLLGNPYQSYLDFDLFVAGNPNLWGSNDASAQTYAVYNPVKDSYLQYAQGVSVGAETASRYINMHQGFFIRTSQDGDARFNNAMRTHTKDRQTGFRDVQPAYPLINFELSDGSNSTDVAVLELGRPDEGGAEKLRVGAAQGRISLRHDEHDFAILFRDLTQGSQPLWFKAEEDGVFTLSWTLENARFTELTLLDNITGARVDMTSRDSYQFEGHRSDYQSRFKVVVGAFADVEEAIDAPEGMTSFAFFDGTNWVVNGKGRLDVIDATGRTICNTTLNDEQNHVNIGGVAQGVYVLRVVGEDGVKTQKIVVR
ncbi:MAG: VWA domain-containing protein [Bacteroidales bacterium]|nr:VWA domain-containing protein [Bacteroidales bacterium]